MSNYNPIPPRVWSRVQNQCTYIVPGSTYEEAFIPLTGQIVSQAQADYETKQIYKGNILQYKANSARLTKSQKYSQLARCSGPNRTKVFATQSQTYTNPNTTGLLRQNFSTYPYPNQIPGAPNNISGPFAYNIPNPNDCSFNSVQDGGILVCGTYANPCTGEIYKTGSNISTICNPASASNVPGPSLLCWNNKVQTWFPRQRYFMNNSTDKWPQGYKGFVSAVKPYAPIINVSGTCGTININWIISNNNCVFIISGYNIYINEKLYITLPANINSFTIDNISNGIYEIYMKSITNNIESEPSNKSIIVLDSEFILITKKNIKTPTLYNNFGFKGIILETSLEPTYGAGGYGELIFKLCVNLTVNVLMVGGGGGGSSSVYLAPGNPFSPYAFGPGGGGSGINYITGLIPPINNDIDIKIGCGGASPSKGSQSAAQNGFSTSISYTSFYFIAQGGNGASTITAPNYGGGNGGNANVSVGTSYGGGGGGGGLAINFTAPPPSTNNGGFGGTADLSMNNGNSGTSTSSSPFPPYGDGGSSQTYSFAIPFLGMNVNVGGGGGGGGFNYGGKAGNGTGGLGGNNNNINGEDAFNYGGGGGGGGILYGSGIPTSKGGNGGNGVIYIWW